MFTQLRSNLKFLGTILFALVFLTGGVLVTKSAQAAYTQEDFKAFDGVNIGTNSYTVSSGITATYDNGTGTESDPVNLTLTGNAPIITPWFNHAWTAYNYVAIGIKLPATGFIGTPVTGGTAVYQADVMRYDDLTNFPNGYYTVGYGSIPLATQGAALGYLDYEFAASSTNTKKDGLVKLKVLWNTNSAPEYFTIDVNGLNLDTPTHKFVSTIEQLRAAITAANSGDTITLTSNITSSSQLDINKAITIDGTDHTLTAGFSGGSVIMISHNDVTIKNLIEDGGTTNATTPTTGNRGINIYKVTGVLLDNVTASNNSKNGIVVNGSTVIVNKITTSNNGWEGIDVDLGGGVVTPALLTVDGVSSHSETKAAIRIDSTTKDAHVVDTHNQYSYQDIGIIRDYTLLEAGQTTPDESGTATVTDTNKDVVVTSSTQPLTIDTGSVTDATIDVGSLVTVVGETKTGTIPQTTITSDVVDVEIPATTITSNDPTWDGTINLPKIITTTVQPVAGSGNTATVIASIEVGFGDTHLTFNDAVKLTFPDQANSLIGWSQNGTFHTISNTCDTNSSSTTINGGATFGNDTECKFVSSPDLIVWTKHFTTFTTYTQTAISHGSSGGYMKPVTPAVPANVETPEGCKAGDKFSTVTGRNCNAATPAVGKVLGAEKFNFTKFLKFNAGSYKVSLQGAEVIELQNFLTTLGYDLGTADGKFGPKTKGAVIKFQIANGLKGDGIVGALTRAALNK